MKHVNLERFVDAYRDGCQAPLDDTALKRRINRTLRERAATNRQRPWLWLFGLGGMLTASLASATPAGQHVISWLQRQLPSLEQRHEPAAPNEAVVASVPKARVSERVPQAPVVAPLEQEPSVPDLAAVPATLNEGSTVARATLPSAGMVGARAVTTRPVATALVPAAPVPTARASVPSAVGNADTNTSLYERAFQLQFSQGNYRAALVAWDNYLGVTTGGALVGEARFHRAVCLVALGRYAEARAALAKIANSAAGAAYQARAHTLLQALDSASQR